MGIGGWLTWTAAAREICLRTGKKVTLLDQPGHIAYHDIFVNNPYLNQEEWSEDTHKIYMGQKACNYVLQDYEDRVVHRADKHIINIILEGLGMQDVPESDLWCRVYPRKDIWAAVYSISKIKQTRKPLAIIEPNSKTNFSKNRVYSIQKYQYIAEKLKKIGFTVLQITNGLYRLKGIDSLEYENFSNAALDLEKADAFITTEGGLVHAASCYANTVCIHTSYNPPKMVCYPQNKNIMIGSHAPCGLKIRCPECKKDLEQHDPDEIIQAAIDLAIARGKGYLLQQSSA